MEKKRNRFLAALGSLCFPGVGHIYIGKTKMGLALAGAYLALGVLFKFFRGSNPWLYLVFTVLLILVFLGILADSIKRCPKEPILLTRWNTWWVYVGIIGILGQTISSMDIVGHYENYKIPNSTMLPTIERGDRIVVDLGYYSKSTPSRGDIIVFRYPKDTTVHFIKRVIGVPGDEVEMKDGTVIINGRPIQQIEIESIKKEKLFANLHEEHLKGSSANAYVENLGSISYTVVRSKEPLGPAVFGPIKVPENNYFVLGDNRDFSNDSRFWGFVPASEIIGKSLWVLMNAEINLKERNFRIKFDRTGKKL